MPILKLSIQPFSNANLANFANIFKKIRDIRPFTKFVVRIVTYFSSAILSLTGTMQELGGLIFGV